MTPHGKRAVVTGASSGLGLEFARLLAADGYHVALVARSVDALETLAGELREKFGITADVIGQDLGAHDAAARIVAAVPECDVLINNAGFASNGAFATVDAQRVDEEVAVDVVSLTQLTRAYLPGMLARGSGRILNVASTASFLPGPFMAVYYAAKAYVRSFSEALWEETRGSGVSVTCLCPGATATGFVKRARMEKSMLMNLPLAAAASVASAGYRGMMHGKRMVIPGIMNRIVAWSPTLAPRRLVLWISRKLVE